RGPARRERTPLRPLRATLAAAVASRPTHGRGHRQRGGLRQGPAASARAVLAGFAPAAGGTLRDAARPATGLARPPPAGLGPHLQRLAAGEAAACRLRRLPQRPRAAADAGAAGDAAVPPGAPALCLRGHAAVRG